MRRINAIVASCWIYFTTNPTKVYEYDDDDSDNVGLSQFVPPSKPYQAAAIAQSV